MSQNVADHMETRLYILQGPSRGFREKENTTIKRARDIITKLSGNTESADIMKKRSFPVFFRMNEFRRGTFRNYGLVIPRD